MHVAPMSRGTAQIPTLVTVFVVIQVVLPLTYYFGNDVFDERFAWRMFSPVRMARCALEVYLYDEPQPKQVRLGKRFHVAWVNLAKRARPAVVDGMVKALCETHNDIRINLSCEAPESSRIGICIDSQDRDGDGIPDGYARRLGCNLPTAEACYQEDCAQKSNSECKAKLCRMTLLDGTQNLCLEGGL